MQKMGFMRYLQEKTKPDSEITRKHSYQPRNASESWQRQIQRKDFMETLGNFKQIGNNQMPAFINRKVKNLKPYTNHFKRSTGANVINNIHQPLNGKYSNSSGRNNNFSGKNPIPNKAVIEIKSNQSNQEISSGQLSSYSSKKAIQESQLSSKMDNQLTCFSKKISSNSPLIVSPHRKVSQISAYEQFLQNTNNKFSNAILDSYNKHRRVNKQIFRNTRGVWKQAGGIVIKDTQQPSPKNIHKLENIARKSMAVVSGGVIKEASQPQKYRQEGSHKRSIQSVNLLPKVHDQFMNSQEVIIMCKNKKYQNNNRQISQERQSHSNLQIVKMTEKNDIVEDRLKKQLAVRYPQNTSQLSQQGQTNVKEKPKPDQSHPMDIIQKADIALDITDELLRGKTIIGKNQRTEPYRVDEEKKEKLIRQSSTIHIKQMQQQQGQSQIKEFPLPKNVSATSFIIFEPTFSKNPKVQQQQQEYSNGGPLKMYKDQRIHCSLNCKTVVEMASLTKIMTFIVCLQACQNLSLDAAAQTVRIGKFQSEINGTSAQIQQGQIYTVQQLYYGLMLPSGNDASLALAVWVGRKLLAKEIRAKRDKDQKKYKGFRIQQPQSSLKLEAQQPSENAQDSDKILLKKKRCYERFINEMNKKARLLGMSKTVYANSHGLSNNLNKSCAFDLAILCEYAMKNPKFRQVVETRDFSGEIQVEKTVEVEQSQQHKSAQIPSDLKISPSIQKLKDIKRLDNTEHKKPQKDEDSSEQSQSENQKDGKQIQETRTKIIYITRSIKWQNTHKLLEKAQYVGIKTGITNTAGPCLASCVRVQNCDRYFIIIVLNSKKLSYRFKDTETLKKWLFKKQNLKKCQKNCSSELKDHSKQDKTQ